MSTVKAIYHIVINTRSRKMTITEENKRELYKYIFGIINRFNCRLLRMNGIANHIHILLQLHPTVALSDLMHEVKRSSSIWLKEKHDLFPFFDGWGKEYAAFTCSYKDQNTIIDYIKGQEVHHKVYTYEDEIKTLAIENDCVYYEDDVK